MSHDGHALPCAAGGFSQSTLTPPALVLAAAVCDDACACLSCSFRHGQTCSDLAPSSHISSKQTAIMSSDGKASTGEQVLLPDCIHTHQLMLTQVALAVLQTYASKAAQGTSDGNRGAEPAAQEPPSTGFGGVEPASMAWQQLLQSGCLLARASRPA